MILSINSSCTCFLPRSLKKISHFESGRYRLVAVKAQEKSSEENTTASQESEDNEELPMEALLRESRGKKSKAQGPKVVSPVVEQVYGSSEPTQAQSNETLAVNVLFAIGAVILVEGIFLAASGFLPQELDEFAQNIIYPIFSPTVVLLLAGSTAYGLWKSRQQ
eukprot:TRINITY_DN2133_c0_g5_i1.p2 TRINITY_DN2133_c0_g5~~TRINITY_DN2133_c0_g5_i1.p2  ORF type:complete len:176 (+),score=19.53 TRINITY_DN2133_c0_g5_i1:37-528(+)